MAHIKPFRGYVYNKEKVKDIARVLAPPYDVISPQMQNRLYKEDDFNIVRLILGKERREDDGTENKYKRAKDFLEELIRKEVLIRDKAPCIYVYDQAYTALEGKKNRIGFISLMRLEDPGTSGVLPHERTFLSPKKDRLNLIRHVKANLSPIFSIFQDNGERVTNILEEEAKKEPIFDIYYEDVRQRLWRASDPNIISTIEEAMRDKQIFIADGHHRYEVALTFRDELKAKAKQGAGEQPYDYVMMYFTSLNEAKLTILATHRVIKDINNLDKEALTKLMDKYFDIEKFDEFSDMQLRQQALDRGFVFGMYCGQGYYLLKLKDVSSAEKIIRGNKPAAWKRLDVSVLHSFILKRVLKIKEKEDNIIYLKDAQSAIEKVRKGGYKLAFFLNPTKLEQVKTIAQMGEMMPHKSTYFYPKLLSGIVINKFD